MTALEKTRLACFIDLASAALRNGYRCETPDFHFSDDPVPGDSAASPAPITEADNAQDSLARIAADVCSCRACSLCETRTNAVPGEGAEQPLVMVIGEGPGADEDATGRPFVGKAGQLLDKMLASIDLSRNNGCFIANVVKCRPPNNRDPLPEETAACAPFLERQMRLLKPQFILCAGRIAAQTMLKTEEPIGRLRGRFAEFHIAGRIIPLLPTYHPSALLRNEDYKRPVWEDLKMLRAAIADQAGIADQSAADQSAIADQAAAPGVADTEN